MEVVAQGANGIEAVDLIEEHHPDLVFLDVQMPGLDGFAVIKRLMERSDAKAGPAGTTRPHLPQIVFATAYDQYAVRAFDVNAVDYLLKPFDRARVEQAVERVRGAHARRARPARGAETQIDALLKLLNRPAGQRARPAAGQADRAGAEPAAAGRPGRNLLRGHRRGRDPRGDADLRGPVQVPHPGGTAGSARPRLFWRAHRGFVVNINHIREVVPWFKSSYQLRMNDKKQTEIPVSRAQTRRLRELFNL